MSETTVRSTEPSPGPGDRRGVTAWWIAAVFVVGLVLAAVVVVVVNRTTPAPTSPVAPASSSANAATRCDVEPGAQEIPTSTPPGVEWRTTSFKTVLPYSAAAGPTVESMPLARCFAHDPVGALVAASQIYARFLDPNRSQAEAVVRDQFVDGPRKEQLLESFATPGSPPDQIQWRAFKYLSYEPDEAVVVLAFESPGRTVVGGLTLTMRWVDEDWQYDFESFANPYVVSEAEVSGYAAWSGIR